MKTLRLFALGATLSLALLYAVGLTIDGTTGAISSPSSVSAGTACPTCAGALDLQAGSDPGTVANTFTLAAPAAMTAPVIWYGPTAPCAGYVSVDITGHLSCSAGTGSGGGGSSYAGFGVEFPISDPTLTAFTWRNQGGATETARTQALFLSAPADSATNTVRGREIAATAAPFSVTIGIVPQITLNYHSAGLYVTDGTKVLTLGVTTPSNGGGLQVASFPSFNAGSSGSQLATTNIQPVGLWYLKVLDDGTNLTWYWSVDGQDFTQIYSAGRTAYLSSISAIGYFASAHNSTTPAGVLLVSFAKGTS